MEFREHQVSDGIERHVWRQRRVQGRSLNSEPCQYRRQYSVQVLTAFALTIVLLSVSGAHGGLWPFEMRRTAETRVLGSAQDTAELDIVGQFGGTLHAIDIEGRYAYLGLGPRLWIADVSDPTFATTLGATDVLPSLVTDVDVLGDYAYVMDGAGTLRVFDVTTPASPLEVGELGSLGEAGRLFMVGRRAYVADGESGLRVIDVLDPTRPRVIGSLDTPGDASGVYVSGGLAYVADGDSGLRVVDVSEPAAMRELGVLDTPGFAENVYIDGGYAYVADHEQGMRIIDVATPTMLREVGVLGTQFRTYDVHVADGHAYVADAYNLRVIDVTSVVSPREVGVLEQMDWAIGVHVTGNHVYVTDWQAGLRIVDVSSPQMPRQDGALLLASQVGSGFVDGGYVYSTDFSGKFRVIDVSMPTAPEMASTLDVTEGFGVFVEGGYAFVADGSAGGLRIIDVEPPNLAHEVAAFDTPGRAHHVHVLDGRAYVADGETGLQIVDVTNPTMPREVGAIDTPDWAVDVHVVGSYAYLADRTGGLRVIDVSEPDRPQEVGALITPDWATGVYVSGNYAYVANWTSGLRVIDVTDPTMLREVGALDTPDLALDVYVDDGLAYVADGESGLRVIDVTNPATPREVGAVDTAGSAAAVFLSDGYVFVMDQDGGLLILEPPRPATGTPTPSVSPSPTSTPTAVLTATSVGSSETPSPVSTTTPTPHWTPSATRGPTLESTLSWPSTDARRELRALLETYYDLEPAYADPIERAAPAVESAKSTAPKDPDLLWERLSALIGGGKARPSPACHAARLDRDFIDCTGARVALTLGVPYVGGHTLFAPEFGFDPSSHMAEIAGHYALYHAFVRDFDAPLEGPYTPTTGRAPRDYKQYHERMIWAYEQHMRSILAQMITEPKPDFQLALTRSAGWLLSSYARTLQALEEYEAWESPADRRNALAIVHALNQRIWWEWVVPQPNGPRTAGKADLGSQATFDAWLAREPSLAGMDRTTYLGRSLPSLRPSDLAQPPLDGLWFDADYTVPGEWYCSRRFHPVGSSDWQRCMSLAGQESLGGSRSPFGHYYGRDASCRERAGNRSVFDCGETNLGSMAEEWLGTYIGARAGLRLIEQLRAGSDPDAPDGTLPPGAYQTVTDRLGYGVAGFHGGDGRQDDLEWIFEQSDGQVRAIRTLSGASHDGERQNGRYSLGETDGVPGRNTGDDGDTWAAGGNEYPGAMENHVPGPNPLYAAVIAQQVLSDKVDGGMSPSLYDAVHRNHPDEFETWVWLLQSSMYRCRDVADPADPSCFAYSTDHWPYPTEIQRVPLFVDPRDASVPEALRYLWRDESGVIDSELIGQSEVSQSNGWCNPSPGLAFSRVPVFEGSTERYLVTEGGFGSYNLILQSAGAFMRLAAARSAEPVSSPDLEAAWRTQRQEVLEPWYTEMERLVLGILDLYGEDRLGYIPDAENVPCVAGEGSDRAPLTHRGSGRMTVESAIAWRARWYSAAALWYWWYDSEWLDVDDRWLSGPDR